jgi:cytoskeletal protein CcmA (bactofilin family)
MPDAPFTPPAGTATLIAPGAEFHGLVVVHGSACIEGRVCGEVVGADLLRVGEQGCVEARVEAGEVWVAGRLEGEIHAERRVELAPTARVSGRIETPRMRVHEGAWFEGTCRMGPPDPPRGAPAPPAAPS